MALLDTRCIVSDSVRKRFPAGLVQSVSSFRPHNMTPARASIAILVKPELIYICINEFWRDLNSQAK